MLAAVEVRWGDHRCAIDDRDLTGDARERLREAFDAVAEAGRRAQPHP